MHRSSDSSGSSRTLRRWKRRARIAAPFLSIPLLLGMLVLSVDLIEYRPDQDNATPARNAKAASPAATSQRPGATDRERNPELGAAISRSSVMDRRLVRLETWEPEVPEALSLESDEPPMDLIMRGISTKSAPSER